MQTEDFEKQVKQKMEALSFSPSDPVWQQIEKEIAHKKERKKIIFWFLSLLLIGIATWGLFNYPIERESHVSATDDNLNKTESVIIKEGAGEEKSVDQVEKEESPKTIVDENLNAFKDKLLKEETTNISGKNYGNKIATSEKNINTTKGFKKVRKQRNDDKGPEQTGSSTVATNKVNDIDTSIDAPKETEKFLEDTAAVSPIILEDSTVTDTFLVVKNENKKWKISTGFVIGRSGISTSAFNFSTPASSSSFFDAAPLQNSSGSAARPVSAVENGMSYSIHISAKKALFKKVDFVTGLRYNYFSTYIHTGSKSLSDTTIFRNANTIQLNKYYRNNNWSNRYKNQYHFVELPVGLSFHLLKKDKLTIEPGLSVGYLLHTNALYYHQQSQIYFSDASVYNKTNLSFYTHVNYTIAHFKKAFISIGPSAQFTLSNLVNNNSKGRQHLYSAGLSTKINFK